MFKTQVEQSATGELFRCQALNILYGVIFYDLLFTITKKIYPQAQTGFRYIRRQFLWFILSQTISKSQLVHENSHSYCKIKNTGNNVRFTITVCVHYLQAFRPES